MRTKDNKWYKATITKVDQYLPNGDRYDGETIFDVRWTDGGKYTHGLQLHQLRNITDYNKFNSARIVDLDTQIEVEEYGMYKDCRSDFW